MKRGSCGSDFWEFSTLRPVRLLKLALVGALGTVALLLLLTSQGGGHTMGIQKGSGWRNWRFVLHKPLW